MTDTMEADAATARDRLSRMLIQWQHSQALIVTAQLGMADLLADGPRPAEELAAASNGGRRSPVTSDIKALGSAPPPSSAKAGACAITSSFMEMSALYGAGNAFPQMCMSPLVANTLSTTAFASHGLVAL